MGWLEVIKVRSVWKGSGLLEELLLSIEKLSESGLLEIKIYRHVALESDLSVHLYWETEQPEQNGTAPGLHLVRALKEVGLVDHSIWIEIGSNKKEIKNE